MGNKLTHACGRMIAESLKGNCSVTAVNLVSAGLFLVRLLLLTCVEQEDNKSMSYAVKREIDAIAQRNQKEPEQRRDEVAAIKQVLCRFFPVSCHLCVLIMAAVLGSFTT
jgi:hypothetical protein